MLFGSLTRLYVVSLYISTCHMPEVSLFLVLPKEIAITERGTGKWTSEGNNKTPPSSPQKNQLLNVVFVGLGNSASQHYLVTYARNSTYSRALRTVFPSVCDHSTLSVPLGCQTPPCAINKIAKVLFSSLKVRPQPKGPRAGLCRIQKVEGHRMHLTNFILTFPSKCTYILTFWKCELKCIIFCFLIFCIKWEEVRLLIRRTFWYLALDAHSYWRARHFLSNYKAGLEHCQGGVGESVGKQCRDCRRMSQKEKRHSETKCQEKSFRYCAVVHSL